MAVLPMGTTMSRPKSPLICKTFGTCSLSFQEKSSINGFVAKLAFFVSRCLHLRPRMGSVFMKATPLPTMVSSMVPTLKLCTCSKRACSLTVVISQEHTVMVYLELAYIVSKLTPAIVHL